MMPRLLPVVMQGNNVSRREPRDRATSGERDRIRRVSVMPPLPDRTFGAALFAGAVRSHRAGDLASAGRHYRQLLGLVPDDVAALNGLGAADLNAGRVETAARGLARASALAPSDPQVTVNATLAAIDRGRVERRQLRKALVLGPALASVLEALGATAAESRNFLLWLGRACAIDLDPGRCVRTASLLDSAGERQEAIRVAAHAVVLAPASAETLNCFGALIYDVNRAGGMRFFQRALGISRTHAAAWANLSLARHDAGHLAAALAAARRALALDPALGDAHGNFGNASLEATSAADAVVALRRALAVQPARQGTLSNLVMALSYVPNASQLLAATAAKWWRARAIGTRPAGRSGRRLRVGYVSSFSLASTRHLGMAAIRQHDPGAIEIVAYAQRRLGSAISQDFGRALVRVRDISGLDDKAAAAVIAGDGIDVLVDLSGHTPGNRLGVFALRPARTQITWIESFSTTGLSAIDWIVTDEGHSPSGLEQNFVERPLRLDRPRFCYAPPHYAPRQVPPPSLSRGYVTFGCFNYPPKISDDTVALWSSILTALPTARLRLKWWSLSQSEVAKAMLARFARYGVLPERIELADASPHEAMLAEYGQIDVALDPFPFSGGVTTCEAAWMGVPVVTLCGRSMVERQSATLLRAIGAGDLVADDADTYLRLALELAEDETSRAVRRMGLRDSMRISRLLDAADMARALEGAYRAADRDVQGS